MSTLRPLWAIALVVVLAAACSSGPREDAGAQSGQPSATGLPMTAEPETPGTSTPEAAATSTGAPQPTIAKVTREFWQFRTPSANIGCAITSDGALCELLEADWAPKQPPTACENADWNGRAVAVDEQETRVGICTTDTVMATDAQVLDYDTGLLSGDVRCISRRDGLTCEHLSSTRGFTVSQARLTLF